MKSHSKICPKCGSNNIFKVEHGMGIAEYCGDCNHGYPNGAFFPKVGEFHFDKGEIGA